MRGVEWGGKRRRAAGLGALALALAVSLGAGFGPVPAAATPATHSPVTVRYEAEAYKDGGTTTDVAAAGCSGGTEASNSTSSVVVLTIPVTVAYANTTVKIRTNWQTSLTRVPDVRWDGVSVGAVSGSVACGATPGQVTKSGLVGAGAHTITVQNSGSTTAGVLTLDYLEVEYSTTEAEPTTTTTAAPTTTSTAAATTTTTTCGGANPPCPTTHPVDLEDPPVAMLGALVCFALGAGTGRCLWGAP